MAFSRRRACVVALLALGALLVPASPGLAAPAPAAAGQERAPQPQLYVLGDSLADPDEGDTSTHPFLLKKARSLGLRYVVHAELGMGTTWGLAELRRHPPARGATVVVQLGTNDIYTPALFRKNLRLIMKELRGHEVLWVNIHVSERFKKGYGLDAAINKTLRLKSEKYPRLHVLDWKSYARKNRIRPTDGLHYDAAGNRARADFIMRAVLRHIS